MTEKRARRRRLIRGAAYITLIPVLLVAGYISSWLMVSWCVHEGVIDARMARRVSFMYAPILMYTDADCPGADGLRRAWWTVNPMLTSQNEFGTVYSTTDAVILAPSRSERFAMPPGIGIREATVTSGPQEAAAAVR